MPGIKAISTIEKWRLFDQCVQPFLEYPPEMKQHGFKYAMKLVEKAFRCHKCNMKSNYNKNGLTLFEKYGYIEPEDCWEEFVQKTESEDAKMVSARFKNLQQRYMHEHCMGVAGYEGIEEKW